MRILLLGVLCLVMLAGCSISGVVTTGGSGLDGVTVTMEGSPPRTTTTAADGSYRFTFFSYGTFTVTPSKPAHEMTPTSREVQIDRPFEHVSGVNFTALKLSAVVAPIVGNITVTDLQNDGTFDTVNTASILEARTWRVAYLNQFYTQRAVLEFDLSGVSRTVPVRSAILQFSVSALGYGGGSGLQLDFHGYRGDGVLNLADATAGDSMVGSLVVSMPAIYQLDLTTFIQQLVSSGSTFAGLNIRTHNEPMTASVSEYAWIIGRYASSSLHPAAKFTIDY